MPGKALAVWGSAGRALHPAHPSVPIPEEPGHSSFTAFKPIGSGEPGSGDRAGGISDGLADGAESSAPRKPAAGRALMSAVRRLSRTKS